MSKPSDNYLKKIELWLLNGVTLERMNMTPDQKLRARMCYEAYHIWMQNKQIRPMELMKNISDRDYPVILRKASEGDELAQQIVDRCGIVYGKSRSVSELANDVAVFNWIIGKFTADTSHIEKAKVIDASDWLIREGMQMMDARAVKSGADLKMQLNNNFDEKQNAQDSMPDMSINITGDVSIIRSDRVNYTEEEKQSLGRRVGMTQKQVQEELSQENHEWQDYVEIDEEDAIEIPKTL